MSYLFSFSRTSVKIGNVFSKLVVDPQVYSFQPVYLINGFFLNNHPVILSEEGKLKLTMFGWGMIKEAALSHMDKLLEKQRTHLLKARAEKVVGDSTSLWYGKRQNRILIPATGFFEHREVRGFKSKVPYYVRLKERPMFFLPGLYNYTQLPGTNGGRIGTLDYEIPSSALECYPVKSLYRADPMDSTLIDPVEYPGLPPVET
jgi:putative SOS response-associated peptidase YedK